MHGRGRFDFANGGSFEGEWEDGKYNGSGTYSWPSGAVYSGEWCKGKMHGNGLLMTADGQQYSGRFHNDAFVNAHGEWVSPNVNPSAPGSQGNDSGGSKTGTASAGEQSPSALR